jgi:hypothetical protein
MLSLWTPLWVHWLYASAVISRQSTFCVERPLIVEWLGRENQGPYMQNIFSFFGLMGQSFSSKFISLKHRLENFSLI